MFTALLAQLPAPSACAGRVLILVNAVALAEQASATVRRLLPHLHVELEQGPQHHASGAADVTVATVQSLRTRLAKYDPGEFKCVVVDEAHHATSPTYRTVLAHFHSDIVAPDALHDQPACARVPIVGFSATFSRHDGTALGTVFESIVYHKDFLAMIEEQWYACLLTHRLCPLRFTAVQAGFDLSDVARSGADYNVTALAKIINTPTINELVVRSWIERAYKQRRATLVFAVNIGHVHALVDEFVRRGIDARAMHSQMPPAMRAEVLEAFRQGAFPVLVNCAILTEGADVPPIDCVLLARPTQSQNLFSQMIGRGMRLSPETNKRDCLILDMVGNLSNDIVCTPTLFGLFDEQPIEGRSGADQDETVETLQARARTRKAEQAEQALPAPPSSPASWTPTHFAFVDYDSPTELYTAMQTQTSKSLQKASPNAWVDCGEATYVLTGWDHSYLKLRREGEEFVGTYYPRNPDWYIEPRASPYWQKKPVLQSPDWVHALRGCDTFMSKMATAAGRSPLWLRRNAQWRQRPASLRAREVLARKLRTHGALQEDEDLPWAHATHGTINTVLTRLRHGGKARWRRAMQAHNRSVQRAQRPKTSLNVRVGPMSSARNP